MKVVKENVETVEEVNEVAEQKLPELCAIPKDTVIKMLNDLYSNNKELFDHYNTLIQVLNSQVNVTNQEEVV